MAITQWIRLQKYDRFPDRKARRPQCSSCTQKKNAPFSAPFANQPLAKSAATTRTPHIPHRTPHTQRKTHPQPATVEKSPLPD